MATIELQHGLIEDHAHLRGWEQEDKETPYDATAAALANGITYVGEMPNTKPPINSPELHDRREKYLEGNIFADTFVYYLADGENYETFDKVATKGFKIFLTQSTGHHEVDKLNWDKTFERITPGIRLIIHKDGSLIRALQLAKRHKTKVHIAHVNTATQVQQIREAKMAGIEVTCEVTDHHLGGLTKADIRRLKGFGRMLPPIKFTPGNVEALWEGIYDGTIDVSGGDHAAHTEEEKRKFTMKDGPYGVPTLDTSAGFKLTAVAEGRLTLTELENLMYYNPKRIFDLPDQPKTKVLVDLDERWIVEKDELFTKCGWSPYLGKEFIGRVKEVTLRGDLVYSNGVLIGDPMGRVIRPLTAV